MRKVGKYYETHSAFTLRHVQYLIRQAKLQKISRQEILRKLIEGGIEVEKQLKIDREATKEIKNV